MNKYVIERNIPQVGSFDHAQLREAARVSNGALEQLDGKVQWIHSLVAADKTFCFYMAENEELVRRHAELSGFPANVITRIETTIDGSTARP